MGTAHYKTEGRSCTSRTGAIQNKGEWAW